MTSCLTLQLHVSLFPAFWFVKGYQGFPPSSIYCVTCYGHPKIVPSNKTNQKKKIYDLKEDRNPVLTNLLNVTCMFIN